jgi:Putative Ig domain
LSTTNPFDQAASAQGNGSNPNSGATPTTTTASELVFGGLGLASSYSSSQTAGSGFTMLENNTGTSPAANEFMLVSSTGSYAASFTLGGSPNWDALVATFAAPTPPVVSTASLPNGLQNTAYSTTLAATGGTAPYTWSLSAGSLPAGLTLASNTGVISGTPTGFGTSNFAVLVTDANSVTGSKSLSLSVMDPPTVTTASLPNGTQNAAYSATLTASAGITPYTWSLSAGTLPAGLTLASNTGVISGIPTSAGTSNFTVQVTDANAMAGTKALSIVVSAGSGPAITTASPLPNATQNVAYSRTVSATGGTLPYTWAISVGTLPNGLTINSSTGAISGTPTVTGTFSFTVQVTDAAAFTGTKTFGMTVAAVGQNLFQLVKVVNNFNAAPGQTSITANMVITSGHFVVAFVREGSNATDNFTISDSSGNTWVQTASGYCSDSTTNRCGMFYSKATYNSSNPTANFTTPGGVASASITVMDFNIPGVGGGADSVTEEGSVNSSSASTSALPSGTLNTIGSSDVLIYAVGVETDQASWTADAAGGFAIPSNNLTTGASGSNARTAIEFKTVLAPFSGTTVLTGSTGGAPMGGVFAGFTTSAVGP